MQRVRVRDIVRLMRRAAGIGAACQVALLAAAGPAAAAEAPPPAHDLIVLVMARSPLPTQVFLSYSHVVDEGRLRSGIAEIGERTGAQLGEVVVEKAPLRKSSEELATAARFAAPGLIRAETGGLPLGAVVRSLPEWEHMRVVFVVDEAFPFAGPKGMAADGYVVRLVGQVEAYEYDVERMSGTMGTAGGSRPSEERSAPVAPAVLIGAAPGLLLGWLLAERRRGETARRR
jgi:hypothetical protein